MLRQSLVGLVLKIGLSISLLYVALFSFLRPLEAIKFYPSFLATGIDDRGIVFFIGIISLFLIGWIFSRKQKFAASLTVTALMTLSILINIKNASFLFTIAPTFSIGVALVLRYYPRVRVISKASIPGTHKKVVVKPVSVMEEEYDIEDDDEETVSQVPSGASASMEPISHDMEDHDHSFASTDKPNEVA